MPHPYIWISPAEPALSLSKGRLRVAQDGVQDVVLGDVDRARMLTGDHQKPAQFSSILARVHSIDPVATTGKSDEPKASPLYTLARVQDHVRGCAWLLGCFVEATANLGRENKVIFEMGDVFKKDYFMIESDVIEEHQVLM